MPVLYGEAIFGLELKNSRAMQLSKNWVNMADDYTLYSMKNFYFEDIRHYCMTHKGWECCCTCLHLLWFNLTNKDQPVESLRHSERSCHALRKKAKGAKGYDLKRAKKIVEEIDESNGQRHMTKAKMVELIQEFGRGEWRS